jgi:DNA-binding transcriptional MerR regulator/methylmalonyl-CoA mutase cobalamin-binding subunit
MGLQENEMPIALIGDVARETGLSKDTLRVWERRYGFPTPARNANAERVYSSEQIQRLQVIRRLLDSGLRPGRIVGLPLEELNSFGAPVRKSAAVPAALPCAPQQLFALIKSHRADELHHRLAQQLMQLGLRQFILEVVVPLNGLVGNAWLTGSMEIFEEHLYAQQVQSLLQHSLGAMPPSNLAPRVLLTTLPGEEHQLGILMAHAFFAMDGAQCVSLGTQTPPADILRAAAAYRVDIVGLSCSDTGSARVITSQLSLLRERLDRAVELWVGGAFASADRHKVPGVRPVTDLRDLPAALAQWRTRSRADDSL